MKNPPKNININYYKDMELADDLETSNSFENDFQAALKFYNETIDRVKNNQYVTLADLSQGAVFKVLKTQKRAIYKMYNQEYAGIKRS